MQGGASVALHAARSVASRCNFLLRHVLDFEKDVLRCFVQLADRLLFTIIWIPES